MTDVTIGTSTCCSAQVSVTRPDGGYLLIPTYVGTKGAFMDTKALTLAGTYRVRVDPQGTATGSMTFRLYDVPPDVTGTLMPGAARGVTTTAPGQNARLTFTGFAGGRISLAVRDVAFGASTCCSVKVSILQPNGTYLVVPTYVGTKGAFFDTKALNVSGTYTVVFDPQGTETGNAALTLFDVPPDATGSLAVGGAPVTVPFSTPGQNARLSFAGGAGQAVALTLSEVALGTSTCCGGQVSVFKPDGTRLTGPSYFGTNGKTVNAQLPVAGTYTVLLDPQGTETGSVTAALSQPS